MQKRNSFLDPNLAKNLSMCLKLSLNVLHHRDETIYLIKVLHAFKHFLGFKPNYISSPQTTQGILLIYLDYLFP